MDIDIMIEAIGGIDASIIDEVLAEGHKMKNMTVFAKRSLLKWAAVAAAIVVIAAGTLLSVKTLYSFNNGNIVNPGSSGDSGDSGIVFPVDGDSEHSSKPDNENNHSSEESGSGKEPVNSAAEAQNKPGEHDQTEAPKPDDAVSGTVFVGLNKVYCGNPTELFPYIEIESIEDVYLSAITSSGKTLGDVDGIVREMVGTTFEITLAEKTEHAVDKAITLLTKDARVKYAGQEFIGEDISSYHMEFDIDGYCCGKLAENVTVKDNTWSFAFDGYKAHIEADGETVEGFLKSGVDYDLVIEMKVIPCFGEYYNFLDIPKENVNVVGLEAFVRATDTTAYEYYEDGEYYVAKFKLPVLELKYETYDFTLNGYSLGADVDKIEVTGADWIEIQRAILKVREGDRLNYTDGCITSGAEYYLQIMFSVPDGVSCYNVPNETILLHGVGEKAIPCTGVLTFGKTSYMTNFPLPAPEKSKYY